MLVFISYTQYKYTVPLTIFWQGRTTNQYLCLLNFYIGLVSRFQSNSRLAHWKAVKRILRYLKGTMDYVLCYQGSNLLLIGYSDVDWGSHLDERKSTSGYDFLLNNDAITWSSKKQPCIALSTMEAEYIACLAAVQEAVWLRRFFQHFEIVKDASDSVTIHCDSIAALAFVKDPKYHGKTKHIDIRYHYILGMAILLRSDPTRLDPCRYSPTCRGNGVVTGCISCPDTWVGAVTDFT